MASVAESDRTAPALGPVGAVWLLLFGAAWFGLWMLIMLPGQFMVVKLASILDPAEKVGIGSFLIFEMGFVVLLAVPVIGWLCDRSRPRFGRRRTWALGGLAVGALAYAAVGQQTTLLGAALLLAVVALGQATMLVSLSAIIADRVPAAQRGRASAAMGLPQVIALAVGMIIVTEVVTEVSASWIAIAGLALLTPLPFLLSYREPAPVEGDARPAPWRWNPGALRGYRDLGWAGLSRVLVNAGNLVGTTYLLFFLSDSLGLADPDSALLVLTLVYLGACAVASWLGGVLTDRLRARRVLVAVSAGLQAAAALSLALVPTWESGIVAAVLLGLGYGTFLSVDQALLTDLLPDPQTRARDLGIVNSAQHMPIAPLVGWFVLSIAGYSELYIVAAVIMLIGGIVVFRIRSVR